MTDNLRETPLCPWHVAHGARMVEFSGWSMPVQYTSIVEEHRATRSAVGLFDISHMGRFRFDGDGAVEFLDSLLTRRVTKMEVGQIRYSLMTNESGGILDDVLAYRLTQGWLLVVNAGNRSKIAEWVNARIPSDGSVQFHDETLETAMIAVQGPRALNMVGRCFDWPQLEYYTGQPTTIHGKACLVSRTGYTGEDGCELIVPGDMACSLWEELLEKGKSDGSAAVGLGARDTLRLEAAMPLYGHELSESITPYQAGLGFAVQLKDRQFVGRDALLADRERKDQLCRVGLMLDGRRVAREHYPVFSEATKVGEVTSGTFSPTLERSIAMAYLRPEDSVIGTNLSVDIRGKHQPASVVPLPFYRRDE